MLSLSSLNCQAFSAFLQHYTLFCNSCQAVRKKKWLFRAGSLLRHGRLIFQSVPADGDVTVALLETVTAIHVKVILPLVERNVEIGLVSLVLDGIRRRPGVVAVPERHAVTVEGHGDLRTHIGAGKLFFSAGRKREEHKHKHQRQRERHGHTDHFLHHKFLQNQ